jgi:D-glycero-D-manno-heptose 1,7-bisphosphate phosphatase
MLKRAVFLDRDGTLIEDKDYLNRIDQVRLLPGVPEGLRVLQEAGFLLIMVTNQSGIGRGYFTVADLESVHQHLCTVLESKGVKITKIYFAPESPGQPSRGRKPSPQFLLDAEQEFGLDLGACYMVGDKWIDLECGWNAGVRQCLLVRTGYGLQVESERSGELSSAIVVDDFPAAAQWILSDQLQKL